jgi:riboflavin kinase/FMN adenylyltransferase
VSNIIRGISNIKSHQKNGIATIGNFDGVHKGHQALIKNVLNLAKTSAVPSTVMTFEPQPLEFFKQIKVARLTRFREKFLALQDSGVDNVLVIPFNEAFSALSAEDFVKQILVDGLAVKHVIVGDDFRFGYKRQGDFAFLQQKGAEYGFTVTAMPSVLSSEQRISSTLIRLALAEGNHALAEQLLGHPYTMMGRVVHGDKLGRQLGFPTANIYLHREVAPVAGIYTVLMHGIGQEALKGVANVGIRPTVGGTRALLEVYLFDFNQDIYGKHVTVEFCKKLRDEERYSNLDLLKEAIAQDVLEGRRYFREEFVK